MKLATCLVAIALVCMQGCASNTDSTDDQDNQDEPSTSTGTEKDKAPPVQEETQVKPQMKPGDPNWPKKCATNPNLTGC